MIGRRAWLAGSLGLFAAAPRVQAQTGNIYRIGYLTVNPVNAQNSSSNPGRFLRGLRELGYIEGRDIVVEYRNAGGRPEQLFDRASELVRLNVDALPGPTAPSIAPLILARSRPPAPGPPSLMARGMHRRKGRRSDPSFRASDASRPETRRRWRTSLGRVSRRSARSGAEVRQLRGPHVRTCAWWSRRSSKAATAAVSPRSLPQSSTGRFEVRSVRRAFVAAHDDLEEVLGGGLGQLPHPEVVDDEQRHRGDVGRGRPCGCRRAGRRRARRGGRGPRGRGRGGPAG